MPIDLSTLANPKRPFRLLQCLECYTLEKLPPYEGRMDEHGAYVDPDPLLEHLISKHTEQPSGLTHVGRLFTVDEDTWNKLDGKTEFEKEMWKEDAERAAFKDTLTEDAVKCFNKHNRPDQGCLDWKDKSKVLGNPSRHPGAPKRFLCDFCPVRSYVETKVRIARGEYR